MTKRILRELQNLPEELPPNCSASLIGTSLYNWQAQIIGASGTEYEGGVFSLTITLPASYPFKPPKVFFTTKIFHPNINTNGAICLEILEKEWSPSITISKVLLLISLLLEDPIINEPVNQLAAEFYVTDHKKYLDIAREWTRKYAALNCNNNKNDNVNNENNDNIVSSDLNIKMCEVDDDYDGDVE